MTMYVNSVSTGDHVSHAVLLNCPQTIGRYNFSGGRLLISTHCASLTLATWTSGCTGDTCNLKLALEFPSADIDRIGYISRLWFSSCMVLLQYKPWVKDDHDEPKQSSALLGQVLFHSAFEFCVWLHLQRIGTWWLLQATPTSVSA